MRVFQFADYHSITVCPAIVQIHYDTCQINGRFKFRHGHYLNSPNATIKAILKTKRRVPLANRRRAYRAIEKHLSKHGIKR